LRLFAAAVLKNVGVVAAQERFSFFVSLGSLGLALLYS
jgi:hypothetical protein